MSACIGHCVALCLTLILLLYCPLQMNRKSIFGTFIVILLIFGFGGCVSLMLLWTGPETLPEENTGSARIVQTIPLVQETRSVAVSAS